MEEERFVKDQVNFEKRKGFILLPDINCNEQQSHDYVVFMQEQVTRAKTRKGIKTYLSMCEKLVYYRGSAIYTSGENDIGESGNKAGSVPHSIYKGTRLNVKSKTVTLTKEMLNTCESLNGERAFLKKTKSAHLKLNI